MSNHAILDCKKGTKSVVKFSLDERTKRRDELADSDVAKSRAIWAKEMERLDILIPECLEELLNSFLANKNISGDFGTKMINFLAEKSSHRDLEP